MSRLRVVGIAVLVVGVLASLAFINVFPVIPSSAKGWLAFFALGIPFFMVAELVGEWLGSRARLAGWPSAARIAVGVLAAIAICAVLYFPWSAILELIPS